jgi:hypothetical protein
MNWNSLLYSLLFLTIVSVWGCSKNDDITVSKPMVSGVSRPPVVVLKPAIVLTINHVVGDSLLTYDTYYQNQWGERFTVDAFKYYISNMVLVYDSVTRVPIPESYYLVDQGKVTSKNITLSNIPLGNLTSIDFLIGVDAFRNTSGVQQGALDPSLGMFWTWNSGYIMAKLEGRYQKGSNANASFIWHCGGFVLPYSSIRNVTISFPQTKIDTIQKTVIAVKADVLEWFKTPYRVTIDSVPVFNDPTETSNRVADNYADMFSVSKVTKTPY